jgi:hypothetical protein
MAMRVAGPAGDPAASPPDALQALIAAIIGLADDAHDASEVVGAHV